jgi:hypothetical protein
VAPLRLGGLRGKKSTPSVWLGGTGELVAVGKQEQEQERLEHRSHRGKKIWPRYDPGTSRVECTSIYCLECLHFFFINSVAEGSVVSVVFPCGSFGAVGIPLNPGRCWGLGLVMIPRSSRYPLGKIFFVYTVSLLAEGLILETPALYSWALFFSFYLGVPLLPGRIYFHHGGIMQWVLLLFSW